MKKTVVLLVLILSLSVCAFAHGEHYSDVKADDWFNEAVTLMSKYGVIEGYNDGSFRPSDDVNRVEFATMMVRALKLQLVNTPSSFVDVPNHYWGRKYIETAKPYLTGFRSNRQLYFKPRFDAQREDMAVALVKALHIKTTDMSVLDDYVDKDNISENLKKYVAAAIKSNLMQGYIIEGKKYFKPLKTITRAESAKLLLNVIKLEKITFDEEKKVVPSDEDLSQGGDDSDQTGDVAERKAIVNASVVGNHIVLNWNRVSIDHGFWGYKVVVSKYNKKPAYPADGYAYFVPNNAHTTKKLHSGLMYHGKNDFGGELKSGETYYVSITTLWSDEKIPGNVITVTIP